MIRAKILIVDDEPDIIESTKFRLSVNGYKVISAYDGVEALERVKREKPDLILMDIIMPLMDGYATAARLKADPRTRSIPIIMFSIKRAVTDRLRGFYAGVDDYLAKPFNASDLLEKIEGMLK